MSKKEERRKVAFYIRVSSFEQNVEGSVGGQRDALAAVAAIAWSSTRSTSTRVSAG